MPNASDYVTCCSSQGSLDLKEMYVVRGPGTEVSEGLVKEIYSTSTRCDADDRREPARYNVLLSSGTAMSQGLQSAFRRSLQHWLQPR